MRVRQFCPLRSSPARRAERQSKKAVATGFVAAIEEAIARMPESRGARAERGERGGARVSICQGEGDDRTCRVGWMM